MSSSVIRAEGLGKCYQIGTAKQAYGTLRESMVRAASSPFRMLRGTSERATSESSVWALRNVSFEVGHGEVVGIIGRNGAGKSTLLRILSRITEPTEGRAEIYGRMGSLLEVGTGFHPELTGRENIYLNGSILGMGRSHIDRRLDEIVEFSGVAQFIDTPVKRYSSGMYLRLAFAVAAHLEPEILVVDEVLAVGDMEFQRKCLGKMEEIASTGRTVLFVSHNMQAIAQLTQRCVVLTRGGCEFDGPTGLAMQRYASNGGSQPALYESPAGEGGNHVARAEVFASQSRGVHQWGDSLAFEFELDIPDPEPTLCFSFQVVNEQQTPVTHQWLFDPGVPYRELAGRFRLRCTLPKSRLYMGSYTVTTWLSDRRSGILVETLSGICPFDVTMGEIQREEYDWAPGAAVYLEDAVWQPVEQCFAR